MSTVTVIVIKNDADLAVATDRLWNLRDAPNGSPEADEAAVLADLIEAYEARHYPMPIFTGRDLLMALMAEHDLSQAQVPEVGPQPLVSAILSGKRRINGRMAVALAKRFKVAAGDFLMGNA